MNWVSRKKIQMNSFQILHFWLRFEYKFCLFSVSVVVPRQIYPSVQPRTEVISIERKLQQVDLDQIRLQPSQPLPERDDDWFVLFDAIREETVILPPGIWLIYICTPSEFMLKHCILRQLLHFCSFSVNDLFGGYTSVTQLL